MMVSPLGLCDVDLDFAGALLRLQENEAEGTPAPAPIVAKLVRKRKLLTADSEIEISKKDYSNHLKDTSSIIKKVLIHSIYILTIATFSTPSCVFDDVIGSSYPRSSRRQYLLPTFNPS